MRVAWEGLKDLTVAKAMRRQVVTVSANATLVEAAKTLREHHVRGVPVVDEQQRCVGVLSTSDLVRHDESHGAGPPRMKSGCEYRLVAGVGNGSLHIEPVSDDLVRHRMSTATQTIGAGQTIVDAARCMQRERIHQLVVIDECARPVGMISTEDILAHVVAAAETSGD